MTTLALDAVEKRQLADLKLSMDELDEADQLLSEADVHLDTLLAPPLERGLFYMSKFMLARKRWWNNGAPEVANEKEMNKACFYLDKALKVFHNCFPTMAAKALKEAALFGNEMGNHRVRNVAATLLYTMPLGVDTDNDNSGDDNDDGGDKEGKKSTVDNNNDNGEDKVQRPAPPATGDEQ